jgi:guanylate kinase
MAGILFIISAPSGSGKSTLVNRTRSIVPNLKFSISYTTRAPRGSEQDGIEYHFIPREEFERKIAKREGKDLLLDIDVQGAEQLRGKVPDAVSIFILPPDKETLEHRLLKRSQAEHVVDERIIRRRLEKAREEIGRYPDYGYILVNDKLDEAVDELEAIVWSERLRRHSPDAGEITEIDAWRYHELAEGCRKGNNNRIHPVLQSFALE